MFVALPGSAENVYTGKVLSVTDGDTFHMSHKGKEFKVRLAEIDTPERGQPYGYQAKQALSDLIFGKRVRVVEVGRNRRIIGRVYVDNLDVNATLVKLGYAWVNREGIRNPELFRLEKEARAGKRGIWALAEAEGVLPWEWWHRRED
jgi:endonuclease YncB( thermonuclease family)